MVVWSDQLNVKFFIATLKEVSPSVSREAWRNIAESLGPEFTADACRFHFAKLVKAQETPSASKVSTPKSASKRSHAAVETQTPTKPASAKKQKKSARVASPKTPEPAHEETELVPPPTPYVGLKKPLFSDDSD